MKAQGNADPLRDTEILKLSAQERVRLNKLAIRGLIDILLTQVVMVLVASLLAWAVSGYWAMLSAFAGGMVYFLPTLLVVVYMVLRIGVSQRASAVTLFIAEGVKIVVAVLLLVLLIKYVGNMIVWPALLLGFILVTKGYLLLLIFRRI